MRHARLLAACLVCVGLWMGVAGRAAEAAVTYAGMIMTASSDKVVYADGVLKGKRVESMEYLEPQDLIRIPAGETLVVVVFETGMREEVAGPALVQVMASGCLVMEGEKKAVVRQPAEHLPTLARLEAGDAQTFGVVAITSRTGESGQAKSLTCLSPAGGMVQPDRPVTFAWLPITGATRYRVLVKDQSAAELKEAFSEGTSLELAGLPLTPGQTLHWTVEAYQGQTLLAHGAATCTVLSDQDATLLRQGEARIETRFDAAGQERDVALALLYRTMALQNDEARALQHALARNPNSEAIRLRLKALNPTLTQ